MRKMVLGVLCALMCILAAWGDVQDIQPVSDFNVTKIAGKWYMTGFATNAYWFANNVQGLKRGVGMFVPTENGDIHFSFSNLKDNDVCWTLSHMANKTDTPGRFTFTSSTWQNENDMRFVDVNYDEYALIYTIKTMRGYTEILNQLFSRSPAINDDLKQNFTAFSLGTGVEQKNIGILADNSECPLPEESSQQ